ncbi:MAG: bifunctional diguanylate cyclase/phosphohydrolase [Planctomycetota bacterium]|jgi:diguanylate cyclase (GGDEF)-like protein
MSNGQAAQAAPLPQKSTARVQTTHPMNSSRLLLDLLALAGNGEESEGWDSVIRRPAMRSLMMALQYREPSIVQHSRRVAGLAVGVAQQLGWEHDKLHILEAAALLHDIGKIGIPDLILYKPGPLSTDETELMSLLYSIAGDVLQACKADRDLIKIVLQSPYHFNGASHDFQVIGTQMHQGARILAVCDAYDSLVTPQAFRDDHTHGQAMEILQRGAGTRYDGNVLSALKRWFETNGIPNPAEPDGTENYQLRPEEVLEAGSLCHVFSYLYLLESLYDGFYVANINQQALIWSHGLEKLTGIPWQYAHEHRDTSRMIQYRDRLGGPVSTQDRPAVSTCESGRMQTTELQLRTGSEEWLPVEVQTLPLIDAAGTLHGFAEIFRDASGTRQKGHYKDLKLMASRDALTHVANRGELRKQLERQMRDYRDREYKVPFSAIFLDVDHFKKCNDTYGHAAGDEVLVSLARLLQHETYSGEMVARYGGEEFVVVCPETGLRDAYQKAERLRAAIQAAQVVKSDEFRITSSFGVATVEPEDEVDTLLNRADKALYMSKQNGRNRVCRLTSQELRDNDPEMVTPPETPANAFVYETALRACVAADMIVYKVKAFVDDYAAKLGEVSREKVVLRVGQKGLVPYWGSTPDKQPVVVTLTFGDERTATLRGASKLIEIGVTVEPQGWCNDSDVFELRARTVVKNLREYFAAEQASLR